MYLFHIFYSFLPLRNPIGFGASDFVSFAITALLVLCALASPLCALYVAKVAASTRWSMLVLAGLPILLRVLLLPRYPVAQPLLVILLPAPIFCALSYWALRGWTTPLFALWGGLLCVFKAGPLSPWMNSYPDGTLAAIAGCLAFGALPRLFKIRPRWEKLNRFQFAAWIFFPLCVSQFLFWYGLHLCAPDAVVAAMRQYEAWL
jgi:hypothetical protein